jgi:hypothetical protein
MSVEANIFRRWVIHSFVSVIVSFILAFSLEWIWFLLSLFLLGYGDSGPSWINTVNNYLLVAGLIIGIVGGQVLFFRKRNEEK